jgi:hypothetical protein
LPACKRYDSCFKEVLEHDACFDASGSTDMPLPQNIVQQPVERLCPPATVQRRTRLCVPLSIVWHDHENAGMISGKKPKTGWFLAFSGNSITQ